MTHIGHAQVSGIANPLLCMEALITTSQNRLCGLQVILESIMSITFQAAFPFINSRVF